eukprot:366332-Chlamydomonas_euryale.AAC.12
MTRDGAGHASEFRSDRSGAGVLSTAPRTYVATQYPAQLRTNVSSVSARSPKGPSGSACHCDR